MFRTVYALLVGIDAYPSPMTPLHGCVNDVQAFEAVLRDRHAGPDVRLELLVLTDAQATRKAVIDGFLTHLCKAGPGDTALFFYAGHGSQQRTPPEYWHLEPDHLDETLVCFDSRQPDEYDLADKELAKLIARVAERDPHIVAILDSCHSGSGTRNMSNTGVRRAPADQRERPASTMLASPAEAESDPAATTRATADARGGWLRLPKGRHVVLSACRDNEEAREVRIGDNVHGVFSHFLIDTLQNASGAWTYRDLFKRVNALVRARVAGQSPVIEATHLKDLEQAFLGADAATRKPYYTVSFHPTEGWVVDAGAVHGIPQPADDETTWLALFPVGVAGIDDGAPAIGEATVIEVLSTRSRISVKLADGTEPAPGLTFKALVTALPLAPLAVEIDGDPAGAQQVRNALAKAADGKSSWLVKEGAGAELRITAGAEGLRIMRAADDRSLTVDIDGLTAASAAQAVERLEHIARWIRIAALANPSTRLAPGAVRMDIYRIDERGDMEPQPVNAAALASGLRFDYVLRNGEWIAPRFKIRLVNAGTRRLYCMLLDLTETFMVSADLLPGGGIWLDKGEEAWALDGDPIDASIPDALWEQGMGEIKDLIKLIISTDEADATLLAQDELDARFIPRSGLRSMARATTLDRLMRRVQMRHLGPRPKPQDTLADWTSSELSITTARPLKSTPIPGVGQIAHLSDKVFVQGHAALKAAARLTSVPLASRSAGVPVLPPLLTDDPAVIQPFEFTGGRGGEPGLSALELVVDTPDAHEKVTPDAPLVITVDVPLTDGEHVLPIGYDGEFHLPLGRSRRVDSGVEITLERLPPPISTRSLTSAIRILFEKVVTETLGREFRYPLLAVVDRNGERTADPDRVRTQVTAAQRIVVYIHGIIGDTIGMAGSAYAPPETVPPLPALADRYDLVLAFDYENLKTPIEQTARDLKSRLEGIGLGAGHGKTLHIVAHSMGGLVSRWFIEREGGNAIVQHLVMLGTPNGGSPWSTIEDWATTALALGMNGLAGGGWPAKLVGGLAAAIERVDVSLDQMQAGSQFLQTLAASSDPGIPYTVLAGNTSIIHAPGPDDLVRGKLARLLSRLSLQRIMHDTAGLAFFYQPNDIAASVKSICAIPAGRVMPATVHEVASDHLSYFSTDAGLRALADALP